MKRKIAALTLALAAAGSILAGSASAAPASAATAVPGTFFHG